MPKNNDSKSRSRLKPARKPFSDVSNGGVRPSAKSSVKKSSLKEERGSGDALDRLLLVHSDLSSLIRRIDELVAQALKVNVTCEKGKKEIESFANALSDIETSLKPWVPRFQKVLSTDHPVASKNQSVQTLPIQVVCPENEDTNNIIDSPNADKFDSLVSPSPLVSWRGDCTTENNRHLFLLTPLPRLNDFSSKFQKSTRFALENTASNAKPDVPPLFALTINNNHDLINGEAVKPTPFMNKIESSLNNGCLSPARVTKKDCSVLVMTPSLKMSPPKSCILLEPISEISHRNNRGVYKSTPFPVGVENFSESEDSESSSGHVSEHLTLKYPELFGIKACHELGNRRRAMDESPNWLMSPPKTCILMEPPDEKLLMTNAIDCQLLRISSAIDRQKNKLKENGVKGEVGTKSALIESTPLLKEPGSTIRFGKHPGENTLKKELWTRFEAASTNGFRFNANLPQETTSKGFLDRLDEAF